MKLENYIYPKCGPKLLNSGLKVDFSSLQRPLSCAFFQKNVFNIFFKSSPKHCAKKNWTRVRTLGLLTIANSNFL